MRFLEGETALRHTSDSNETEVSPEGAVLREAGGDVGQFTAVWLMTDVTVDNGDTVTTVGYWSEVLFSTRLVPIQKAHILVSSFTYTGKTGDSCKPNIFPPADN